MFQSTLTKSCDSYRGNVSRLQFLFPPLDSGWMRCPTSCSIPCRSSSCKSEDWSTLTSPISLPTLHCLWGPIHSSWMDQPSIALECSSYLRKTKIKAGECEGFKLDTSLSWNAKKAYIYIVRMLLPQSKHPPTMHHQNFLFFKVSAVSAILSSCLVGFTFL